MRTNDFLNAICDALGRKPNSLSIDDTRETVEEWDSVGYLSIIATIDEELDVSVEEEGMRNFKSIRELIDRLKARDALEY